MRITSSPAYYGLCAYARNDDVAAHRSMSPARFGLDVRGLARRQAHDLVVHRTRECKLLFGKFDHRRYARATVLSQERQRTLDLGDSITKVTEHGAPIAAPFLCVPICAQDAGEPGDHRAKSDELDAAFLAAQVVVDELGKLAFAFISSRCQILRALSLAALVSLRCSGFTARLKRLPGSRSRAVGAGSAALVEILYSSITPAHCCCALPVVHRVISRRICMHGYRNISSSRLHGFPVRIGSWIPSS